MPMAKVIGIDLGTTNSEAAYTEGGTPKIIPSAEGSAYGGKMFPSVVAFTKDGILVGEPAKRQAVLNPEKTVMQIKRKMGTDYKVRIDGKDYTPQEISAMILRKLKTDAEAFLGEKISQVVITVPAYFNDNQRQATKDAGKIAGLEVLRLVNEPTAAALAYGLDKKGEGKIAVLDLGGGTFDVTLMEMGEGVFEVVSTSGDTQLGGMDMDNALIQWLVTEFKGEHGVDLSNDRQAMQRLRDAAEKAKIELSSTVETTLNLPFIAQKGGQPVHLEKKLTRSKLEQLIEPVLQRLDNPIRHAEARAEEDRRRRELVDLRNGADQLVYATEKLLKEHGSAVSEATRRSVEEKLEALKKVLTTDDVSVLRNAIDALNREAQKIGTEMYGKGGPAEAPPPGSGDSGGSPGPGVVDADFEDVD